ncbi:MAG: sulfite exporter TauE/SafE family protein [Actinomycetaceae bacterium]|nr:sulfite exporter TauE/SafE family protein [Actinomycetaceae bacterium]
MADSLLFLAGVGAGILGYFTGLASLTSYPALIFLGVPPVMANTTNTVAIIGTGVGSVAGAWKRIKNFRGGFKLWPQITLSFVAGLAGGLVLLAAGSSVFETLVPWFILMGTVLFFFAPAVRRRMAENTGREQAHLAVYLLALSGATFYCGYFSAGAGMIILAIMALMTNMPIGDAVAVKALMVLVANVSASIVFIVQGRVLWHEAIVMGFGAFLGGFIAPKLQRFVPDFWLRVFVIIGGLVLTAWLFLRNFGVTI